LTELGNRLKEARIAKGLSLDDLQTITKIQKRYLVGIEEGNYSTMPGNFYVRAFVKQYAEAVQLNPEEIFETYKSEIPSTHNEDLPEQLSRVKTRKPLSERGSKIFDLLPKVLITALLIGAGALIYYFLQQHAGSSANEAAPKQNDSVKFEKSKNLENVKASTADQEKKKNSTKKAESKDTSKDAAQTEPPKQAISPGQISGKNATTYQVTNADKFVVKLVSRGSSWVSIKNSKGTLLFQGVLKTGETDNQTVDLSGDTAAVIRVGNANGTDIFVNDQKVDYAIPPNSVTVQNITIQYVPKTQ
jgi:cytoskeletal protein RodZ